ncbi:hypothetical protein JRQ81_011860 [Phrynocephalus forsythii]|uniref:Uncharacterized protein n=1 Tax=Phrynocephalus forsythii TaxID=171643 RepID=A0A9Q0X761_9SAUR|nr:hypothetical protein JRQ81_011860 [Phrynocephalus forsythii]
METTQSSGTETRHLLNGVEGSPQPPAQPSPAQPQASSSYSPICSWTTREQAPRKAAGLGKHVGNGNISNCLMTSRADGPMLVIRQIVDMGFPCKGWRGAELFMIMPGKQLRVRKRSCHHSCPGPLPMDRSDPLRSQLLRFRWGPQHMQESGVGKGCKTRSGNLGPPKSCQWQDNFSDSGDFHKDICKRDLKALGMDLNSWETLTSDRTVWRQERQHGLHKFEEAFVQQAEEKRQARKERNSRTRQETEYICPQCGRDCHSRIGLFSHTRVRSELLANKSHVIYALFASVRWRPEPVYKMIAWNGTWVCSGTIPRPAKLIEEAIHIV